MKLAQEYGLNFLETSAMSNENVDLAFVGLARQVIARVIKEDEEEKKKTSASNIKLTNGATQGYLSGCCYGGGNRTKDKTPVKNGNKSPFTIPNKNVK